MSWREEVKVGRDEMKVWREEMEEGGEGMEGSNALCRWCSKKGERGDILGG